MSDIMCAGTLVLIKFDPKSDDIVYDDTCFRRDETQYQLRINWLIVW
jgi:hypothetical protein